jgi:hypothetical protein
MVTVSPHKFLVNKKGVHRSIILVLNSFRIYTRTSHFYGNYDKQRYILTIGGFRREYSIVLHDSRNISSLYDRDCFSP